MDDWAIPENKITLRYHVKYNPLDFPPVQAETEYRESLILKDCPRDEPPWDLARAGPSCAQVDYKREIEISELFLKEMRRRDDILSIRFKAQYEQLLLAEEDLRTHFLQFNKFIRENKEKTERAQRKLETEGTIHVELQQEVKDLTDKVKFYETVKYTLQSHIDKYKIYETYLQNVVEISANLHSVVDTYKRYDALTSARDEISLSQRRNMHALEKTLNEIKQMSAEKNAKIITLNTELAEMDKRYRAVKNRAAMWEASIVRIKNLVYEKESEIHIVRDLLWDMYTGLVRRRSVPVSLERGDMEGQLKFIQVSVNELRQIVEMANQLNKEERLHALEQSANEPVRIDIQTMSADAEETEEEEIQ